MNRTLSTAELNIMASQAPESRDYWLRQLSGFPLTGVFQEPAYTDGLTGRSSVSRMLANSVSEKLIRISGGSDEKLQVLVLAAVAVTLYKYTGNYDVVLGTTPDGESPVNTVLPLRLQADAGVLLKDFIYQVNGVLHEALSHGDYPLQTLAPEFMRSEDPGEPVWCTAGVVLKNLQSSEAFAGLVPPLLFLFERQDDSITFQVDLDRQRYHAQTAAQLSVALGRTMAFMASNSASPLSALQLMHAGDAELPASFMNNPDHTFMLDENIVSLFEQQVKVQPDAIAVSCVNEDLTFSQLNDRANAFAQKIRCEAPQAGEVVAIFADRAVETVVGILGILKAGCAYLPVEFDTPASRLRFMFDNSGVRLIACRQETLSRLSADSYGENNKLLVIDTSCAGPLAASTSYTSRQLAYVIYTSGSTGEPKGVMMSHRSAINLVNGLNETVFKKYGDRLTFGLLSPFIFDASIQLMFGALMFGHTLRILGVEERMEGNGILRSIGQYGIQVTDGTPAHIALMLKCDYPTENITTLKHCIIGGDVLLKASVEKFVNKFTSTKPVITNVYGPTECCVNCSYFEISDDFLNSHQHIPIGVPFPNYELCVVNNSGGLCPVGEPGELWVSGEGLTSGYINDLKRTEDQIVANEKIAKYKKFYRTGDLARLGHDGLLTFLGRIDNQVKVRGYRIELGEIDEALNRHEAIKQSVSLVKEDQSDKYIVSYYVAERALDVAELRKHLGQRLPAYMMPSYFVKIDQVPVTATGKPDRKSLPDPQISQGSVQADLPETETESKVLEIFRSVLKADRISVNEGFFIIGGDSIRAISLVYEINELFGTDFMLMDLYQHDSIRKFSRLIDESGTASSENGMQEAAVELDSIRNEFLNKI